MARRRAIITPETYTVEILGRRFPVTDMVDASRKVSHIIDQTGMGASQIGAEFTIRDSRMRVLGYVSYNGKVWKGLPGSWPNVELMYDPYTGTAQEAPERLGPPPPPDESFCRAHTHTKDYTRPGERFIRCGWCHAKRVDDEGREYRPATSHLRNNPVDRFGRRYCDIHWDAEECAADRASCRYAGCDGADDPGTPDCLTPAVHYDDTKSFFCDAHRKKFLQDYRFDHRRGEWVERRR